jgi:hypothetical protein
MPGSRVGGDSPGQVGVNDFSSRGLSNTPNVSRGDSLAYSEDSGDIRNLLQGTGKGGTRSVARTEPHTPVAKATQFSGASVLKKPCCQSQYKINDSMASEESLRIGDGLSDSKNACCVIQ